jgi:hypothetical protein
MLDNPAPKRPEGYADLADLPEDERIRIIIATVANGKTVAVCVDDHAAKIERYKRKLAASGGVILSTTKGPVKGAVTITVGPQ